jgi:hypothetical protein
VCRHCAEHPSGGCTIQRAHGHDAIPRACQQFPRAVTQSPLGTSVTLSAFCPTAASLLFDEGPFHITILADAGPLEGLDARQVLPPLLRPGMLMDWEAVAAWEELAVAALSDHREDVDRALAIIEAASESVSATWTPAAGSLSASLRRAFEDSAISSAAPLKDRRRDRSLARPHPGDAGDMPDSISTRANAPARYFAAHAFACWPMYDGRGIRGALDWLNRVRATLVEECRSRPLKEAMRQADLRLRHAASRS